MCGIVGVISKRYYGFINKDVDTFNQLLYADALRGDDATGVITVEKNSAFHIDKEASTPENFRYGWVAAGSPKLALSEGRAMIGHNRKATMGKITDETSHPFVIDDTFAMVHNGTLYAHKKLADTEVDSEALAMVIKSALDAGNEKDDHVAQLGETLSDVNGAYACVWYDQINHKVQLIRNSERPMSIVETADLIWFASEGPMLQWILNRNGYTETHKEIVAVDTLYSVDLATTANTSIKKESVQVKKPVVTTPPMRGGTPTTTTSDEISKSNFKRLRKQFLNTKIMFRVVDTVHKKLFQESDDEDFLILGQSAQHRAINHMIKGIVNVKTHELHNIDYVQSFVFEGTVIEMEYNRTLKRVDFLVDPIEKVTNITPISTKVIHETPIIIQ